MIDLARLDAVLQRGRDAAEARMRDTWIIGTDLGWIYDPDADDGKGADVQIVQTLFTTKARLKATGGVVQESEAGGRVVAETRRELHIPVGSPDVPAGAVAQCTELGPRSDPTLLGVIVRLSGPAPGSEQTARRLEVVEVLT